MVIWKFYLKITDEQAVEMPKGAKILDVQMQRTDCCMWAICDPSADKELRKITMYGTGHDMPTNCGEYIGTFQLVVSQLVFHVFDAGVTL